jgi:hypothetical protein
MMNMRKEELLEILHDWNFWRQELECGRERKGYIETCQRLLKTNVVVAITGVRRSGKSYIMRGALKKLASDGLDPKNTLMVNFEDRRFPELYPKLLDELYETYLEFLKPDKKPFIFLDEIHNVPKWEKWVRTMHELGKAKITISGSSSKLLAGELATVLTGRHLDISVFPLSFKEFLQFKNIGIKDKLDIASKKTEIRGAFNEYFEYGGFPEVVLSSEKKQLLLTYFDDIITRDIEKRFRPKKTGKLRELARFYLTNVSNPVTFNSLKNHLDTTTNTIEKYSAYLEEANIIFFVKRHSYKVREQEKSPRKVYAIDVGLANAIGFKFSSNAGKNAENIVAIRLKKDAREDTNTGLYYWKDAQGREVDFVIKEGSMVKQLIQACYDTENLQAKQRETKALLKASRELKCNSLLVITGEKEGEEKTKGKTIRYLPLWKWLLDNGK